MKETLLKLVAAIEDLRANQDLLAARVGTGVSLADAADAKNAALKAAHSRYADLRKEIEAL